MSGTRLFNFGTPGDEGLGWLDRRTPIGSAQPIFFWGGVLNEMAQKRVLGGPKKSGWEGSTKTPPDLKRSLFGMIDSYFDPLSTFTMLNVVLDS